MTIPSIIFGFLIATLIGAGFHLWKGGGIGKIVLYIGICWIGFWFGHWIGNILSWSFASVGPINLGMALIGTIVFLGIGYWLSLVKVDKK